MFNFPPNFNEYIQQLIGNAQGGAGFGGSSYKVDGTPYVGPFAAKNVNPFRTVDGIGGYGQGRNASASQLYEHFSGGMYGGGRKYKDVGLRGIAPKRDIQTIEDFLARRNPQTTTGDGSGAEGGTPPVIPGPDPSTNTSGRNGSGNQIARQQVDSVSQMPSAASFGINAQNIGGPLTYGSSAPAPQMPAMQAMPNPRMPPPVMPQPTAPQFQMPEAVTQAMQQLDRGNIFGQMMNMSSNFQPPMPSVMAGMGKGR